MNFTELNAYQLGFELAMEIFEISKSFQKVETYSLIDQIRRRSRSVCAQIAEAYRVRQYPAHFESKLATADAENSETQVWLQFSLKCGYLEESAYHILHRKSKEIGKLLGFMIRNPQKFGVIKRNK